METLQLVRMFNTPASASNTTQQQLYHVQLKNIKLFLHRYKRSSYSKNGGRDTEKNCDAQ